MYLFLGGALAAKSDDIIGIFVMDTSTVKKVTRDFLNAAERAHRTEYANDELPKSFIVTDRFVYISPLNTSTLRRRAAGTGGTQQTKTEKEF